jgi:hypothetical protein
MKRIMTFLTLGTIAVVYGTLVGCMPVASPVVGTIFTEAKWGYFATTETAATKEGKACAQTVLGWVATGDASVTAAKAAGGITKVAHIDHTSKNILGLFAEFCTIVKGS